MSGNSILVFSPYYPPHVGGLESHAAEWNYHMAERGYHITVLTPRLPQTAPEREQEHERVKVIRFPAVEIIPNYPVPAFWKTSFRKQWNNATRNKPDIVVSRTRFFLTALMALWYAKTRRIPWIHIEHGSDYVYLNNTFHTMLARWYDHTFGKLVFRTASGVVANSRASAAFVRKITPKVHVTVIYRGVPVQTILDTPLAEEFRSNIPTVAYLGRLIDGKGVTDLLKALEYIEQPIRLFIIGDGPERSVLERQAREQGKHEIRFFGQQPFGKAIALLKVADIVVNPSYNESFGTSILEAALCKRAIIATNVGGLPEIVIGDGDGFLVPPHNPDAIAEKIHFFLENSDQQILFGNRAFRQTRERFNWKKSINSYIKIFQNHVSPR